MGNYLGWGEKANVPDEPVKGNPTNEIQLMWAPMGIGNVIHASPFVTKMDVFLRMAGLPYKRVVSMQPSAKQQIPWIVHGPTKVNDSQFITKYLLATYPDQVGPLYPQDPQQRAKAQLVMRLLEEWFYTLLVYYRWVDPPNTAHMQRSYFKGWPWFQIAIIMSSIQPRLKLRTHMQGWAKHSEGDRMRLLEDDLDALVGALGDGPFLCGKEPCFADATMYGSLENVLLDRAPNTLVRDAVAARPSLLAYVKRVRERYYEDEPPVDWSELDNVAAAAVAKAQ